MGRADFPIGRAGSPSLAPIAGQSVAAAVTLAYALIAVAWTWPLATSLTHDVPWDLGDSLLNCWILAWHFHQAGRGLRGDIGAFGDWWHPNIFHPAPYAIGHSELLVAQAVQGAPVFAATGNLILTYNLLFLSSFILSALGVFLLVRSLTRDATAGFVAGLLYGFALYRVAQGPHLQVLSSQWFPFVLWGLHEWWERGRLRHAVLAGLALAAQNLSNGYFLVYAALWLPPYVVAQIVLRRRVLEWRAWMGPVVAAAIGVGITAPFLYPYLQLRALGQPPRPLVAVVQYSADTQAWLTANDQLRFWGSRLQTLVRPEGDLFPGLVPLVLVALLVLLVGVRRWQSLQGDGKAIPARPADSEGVADAGRWLGSEGSAGRPIRAIQTAAGTRRRRAWVSARGAIAAVACGSTTAHAAAIVLALFGGHARLYLGPVTVSITDGTRLLMGFAVSAIVLLAASSRARRLLRDDPQQPVVAWLALAAMTVWLSFGPIVHVGGRIARTWPSLYLAVYELVPGADALRVPPRIAMVTALALSVLGGLAVAELTRRRGGTLASGLLAAAFVAESWPAPVPINLRLDPAPLAPLTEPIPPRPDAHPLARAIAALPPDAVLVDLPFGSLPYEVWWQYLSAGHWRARVNGYSGDVPAGFLALDQVLSSLPGKTEGAMDALHARGTTHAVLHAGAWPSPDGPRAMREWLRAHGATLHDTVGSSEIWRLAP